MFCERKLASVKIPPEVMSDWEHRSLTNSDWVLEFQAINGTYDTPTSVDESQIEKEIILESSLTRTPAKLKKHTFGGEEYEGLQPSWKSQKYVRTLPDDPGALESFINKGVKKGVTTTTVLKIERPTSKI